MDGHESDEEGDKRNTGSNHKGGRVAVEGRRQRKLSDLLCTSGHRLGAHCAFRRIRRYRDEDRQAQRSTDLLCCVEYSRCDPQLSRLHSCRDPEDHWDEGQSQSHA
jgi:hypothetical protein